MLAPLLYIKVANVPLVLGMAHPRELDLVNPKRVFGMVKKKGGAG